MYECIIKQSMVGEIPLLLIYPKTHKNGKIIFLFHALLLNKTNELPFAFCLAKEGYFIVIIDTHYHGDREQSFEKTGYYNFHQLYKTAYDTAKDVPIVSAYLQKRYRSLDFTDITCIGVSNGANIAMMTGYLVANVTRVASLIGTLNWNLKQNYRSFAIFAKQKITDQSDKIKNEIEQLHPLKHYQKMDKLPHILIQNGLIDTTINIVEAEGSFGKLYNVYEMKGLEHLFVFKKYNRCGHRVTPEMVNDVIHWLSEQ